MLLGVDHGDITGGAMESIKWQTGQTGQLEFTAQTGNANRHEVRDAQPDLAGLHRISVRARRSDSWLDATVTLLATIVFGLGWAVVELEGALPVQAGYDQASQNAQAARAVWSSSPIDASMLADAPATESTQSVAFEFRIGEMWGAERERWTDLAPQSSKQ